MTRSLASPRPSITRLVLPLLLALMVALQVQSASAGISWCRTDPLISVNGRTGHVYVESTEAMFDSATGPIVVEVLVPKGTLGSAWAEPLDNGFGYGYTIRFREDPKLTARGNQVEVRVRVHAPAKDGSLPVRVRFHADSPDLKDSIRTSSANAWIETGGVKL